MMPELTNLSRLWNERREENNSTGDSEWCFSNLKLETKHLERLLQCGCGSAGLGWGRFCISVQFPGDATLLAGILL